MNMAVTTDEITFQLTGVQFEMVHVATPFDFKIFEEDRSKIQYTHIENIFDDYKKQILLPHKLSQFGPAVAVADVNGDRLEDVYIGSASGKSSKLYLQTKEGGFVLSGSQPWNFHKALEDVDAVFFDSDNDGDNDLYVVSGGNEFAPNSSTYLDRLYICLLYTSPSPRDKRQSRMPS